MPPAGRDPGAEQGADVAGVGPRGPGTLRAVPRFYITTPIYYVNDAPHVGHAYATVNADAMARWHRLVGDDVFFLTGTDEHGAKVAEAAAEHAVSPQEWADRTSRRFLDAWSALDISNDDFIRTSEPRHHRAVQRFLQRIYDNGFIVPGTYRGLYCVSCEDYYTEDRLVDGCCPVHLRPVVEMEEENYFFKLSEFEQPLIEWYERLPDAVAPAGKRNEALSFIKGGLQRHLHHPDLPRLGGARPLGRPPRLLRLVRRAGQLPHRHRLRGRRSRLGRLVAGGPPPDRQGDPALPLRVVAGHVHGRRHRPAGQRVRARLAAGRGPEALQDPRAQVGRGTTRSGRSS